MNFRKFSVFGFALLGILFATNFALAAGVDGPITGPNWFLGTVSFFGLGESWATFIISLAVLAMIFAATYGILEFTAFEQSWVKGMIAAAIAVVCAVTKIMTLVTAWILYFVGGSIIIGTGVAIVIAVVFFIIAGFFKGRMKASRYKKQAIAAEGAMDLAAVGVAGAVKQAKAALRAAEKK